MILASLALTWILAVVAGLVLRMARLAAARRRRLQWLAATTVVAGAAQAVLLALHLLLGFPASPMPWVPATLVLPLAGLVLGRAPATARRAERALVESLVVAGLTVMVVTVYLTVVVGLGRSPVGAERDVLLASILSSITAVALALPMRFRLVALGRSMLQRHGPDPAELLASFGARMSRAVPFDELLLQLVESLRATLGPAGAEVWVGSDGRLSLAASVPERQAAELVLDAKERVVVGRTRTGGNTWLSVWLPALLDGPAPVRAAPAAHLGELLGLLVVRRAPGEGDFTDDDDRVLVELARQVALALHNMRLDTALQASLAELRRRNEELQASRLRIVTAADASRRAIERDLHDGAQQHLAALSVKLGLAAELLRQQPATLPALLEELRDDVRQANAAVRELAHGIYPPLLRNHGLGQALRSVARRVALPYSVEVCTAERYPEQVEAAVYFCCLEAVQNAGKHAGEGASVRVRVWADPAVLRFTVSDDGRGFEPGSESGHGFVNMADRLGAIGGALQVEAAPGAGTVVRGEIPLTRLAGWPSGS
ncbi:histidine kinase [Nonomuraea sp. NPDC050663]|uniref:sensor histidine kinase n=1 Tax=Nonomuraea sp. NPDC050663 TaxID=3364370 RepID=UPI0037B0FCCB